MNYGAVPEIVAEGISGYTATTREEFASIVPKCFSLDRRQIQQQAREKFSAARMAQDYAALYAGLVKKL
jgi:glycosyltransferase involved in cell wall biosynthesis